MKKAMAVLFGMCLTNAAFAVIPAGTELPIVVVNKQKVTPGEDSMVSFHVDKPEGSASSRAAARRLADCTLEGMAHLDAKTQRITLKNPALKCDPQKAEKLGLTGASPDGQIIGPDRKTGMRVTCKHQPGCLQGTLKDGDKGFFLFAKPFGN